MAARTSTDIRIAIDARKAFDGGIGRHLREIARRLPPLLPQCRFTLLVAPGAGPELAALGLGPPTFDLLDEPARKYGFAELWRLPAVARRLGCRLFHAPHYVLPPAMPCPTVVTIHDVIHVKRPRTPLHRWYARSAIRSACRSADAVVSVSRASASDIAACAEIPLERIVVVPNGVDLPETAARKTRAARTPPRYALYVGSLKPHKNVASLVEAMARVFRVAGSGDALELWLAGQWRGEERHRRRLEALTERLGLGACVRFIGGFPDSSLTTLFGSARMLVAPSWEEGFGLPALEALAHGTPVVASRRGAHPEVLGDAATYAEDASPDELAHAILRVDAESASERTVRATRGRERAAHFTWEAAARGTASIYRDVLGLSDTIPRVRAG